MRSRWYALAEVGVPRRWWVYPRSKNWWEQFIRLTWDEEQWIENFRMSRATFFEIVEALRPRLQRQTTNMREPIPVEKRVAIAIWYLANANCYREVREQFGVGLSTVGEIVLEVCCAMELDLLRKTVCLGDEVTKVNMLTWFLKNVNFYYTDEDRVCKERAEKICHFLFL